MKKLLVTGGSGYLGQHLVPRAMARYEVVYSHFATDPLGLENSLWIDLRDGITTDVIVRDIMPDWIIHLAGSNRSPDMHRVIVDGTRNIVASAEAIGARLIHLSTDVLFDGTAAPYVETDKPTPIHAYGRAKAIAEKIVAGYRDHVIVRTSLIYSDQIMDMGTRWMKAAIERGEPLSLFSNHLRNPVHADDLADACFELLEMEFRGILHVAGGEALSRAQYAMKTLNYWGVPLDGVTASADESGKFPLDVRLDIGKAREMLYTELRGVSTVFGD
jgi:dTDP-4-dehydrorhamnose reductase